MSVVPRTLFLTKFQLDIYDPTKITDDFRFSFASEDTLFREVETRYEYVAQQPVEAANRGRWLLQDVLVVIAAVSLLLLAFRYILKQS